MKLKNLLLLAFLTLTLIPIIVVSLLLYKSGFHLSKEAYTRNLIESLTVQVDYVGQSIENNMISDYRFAKQVCDRFSALQTFSQTSRSSLLEAFQAYLKASEDRIAVCILLDKDNIPVYTIGEKDILDTVRKQLPKLETLSGQKIQEFELTPRSYSLGILTPLTDANGQYRGSFISVYTKHHLFKTISSYYKIVNTSTYLCRENGCIVNARVIENPQHNDAIEKILDLLSLSGESRIDMYIGTVSVSGYYKNIHNTPWFLVGFIDEAQIYAFTNRFVWVYFFIIIGVCVADILLAFYFSRKVVEPINGLIQVMDEYQKGLEENVPQCDKKYSYFEIRYLWNKFSDLMRQIMLAQHNFEGIYQLYQSNDMGDINIDIDVIRQTATSNKEVFQKLMNELELNASACVVERFVKCFCEKDQVLVMEMLEKMRDEHLAVASEIEIYTPYMDQRWFHTLIVPLYKDDRLSRLFIQLRDISSFKRQEYESNEQARRDPLTCLYNRAGFTERVSAFLQNSTGSERHGLLFIDMDYFKLVNDTLGHGVGDDLLCSVGGVLLNTIGAEGVASRFGGDEFAVFLPGASLQTIENIKTELNERLIYPFHSDTYSFVVSASIGVAVWTASSPLTLEQLLHQADVAMYDAKRFLKKNPAR